MYLNCLFLETAPDDMVSTKKRWTSEGIKIWVKIHQPWPSPDSDDVKPFYGFTG